MKFGKIEPADLTLSDCPFEPGAPAMVLCDYSESEFNFRGTDGFAFEQQHHKRIKIFNKNGLDQANIHISYFAGKSGNFEKVRSIKALCHYLEDGKVKSLELPAKEIFTTESGYGYREISFAIPGAREGCIIEYSYEISSLDLANLRDWYFQEDIPVLYSECRMVIPQFLQFQNVLRGELPISSTKTDVVKRDFNGFINENARGAERISFSEDCNLSYWVVERAPTLRRERLMGPARDFASHMEFQLLRISIRGSLDQEIMSSYSKYNQTLLSDSDFGKLAEPGRFEKDLVSEFTNGLQGAKSQADAILHRISERVQWNGHYGLYVEQKAQKLLDSGKGTTAEINLLAVACLRAAGIKADPVILGTRDYARLHPVFPNQRKFNYVILVAEIDGKLLFGDAATPGLPLGVLPENCLHGDGWRVSADQPGFINLQADAVGAQSVLVNLEATGEAWSGKVTVKTTGQLAAQIRETRANSADQNPQAGALFQALSDWTTAVPQTTHSDEPVSELLEFSINRDWEGSDLLYLKPVLTGHITSNPLEAGDRHWPLEFPFASNYTYVLTLALPAGFTLAEKPEEAQITFGDNRDLVFQYRCSESNGTVTVISKLQMKRINFLPDEYADLLRFYDLVVRKNQEMLVLKKG